MKELMSNDEMLEKLERVSISKCEVKDLVLEEGTLSLHLPH